MKTTLLILFSTCLGLLAQAAPAIPAPPSAAREEATNVVDFPGMDLNTFLDVYANVAGRTVLHGANLQAPPIKLKTEKPLTRAELVEAMKQALETNGVAIIDQGSHLARAVFRSELAANSAAVAAMPTPPSAPGDEATNNVDFNGIDVNTFLSVYAGLMGRTVMHSSPGAPPITLKTVKPLTRAELGEAMRTVLELNGIAVTNLGSNFIRVDMIK